MLEVFSATHEQSDLMALLEFGGGHETSRESALVLVNIGIWEIEET